MNEYGIMPTKIELTLEQLQQGVSNDVLVSPTETKGEAFSLARIAEACFEDEQSTIAIAKPNELTTRVHVQNLEQTTQGRGDEPNHIILVMIHHMIYHITVEVLNKIFSPHGYGCNIYEGCCQLDIQFSNLEELQENQEEHICYYNWENCFSILNAKEAGITKSPLSADTFGNSGVDESETSGSETPAKEVVDNGNGSALIFLVGYGTGSEVVTGLPEEFQEGYMVDALSRVLEHKSSEKGVDSGSRKRDYALFGASLFAFLNLGPGSFAHRRIWDPGINRVFQDNTLRTSKHTLKVVPYPDTTQTGSYQGVLDEFTVVFATSSKGTGTKLGVPDEEKVSTKEKVILEWGSEQESEYSEEELSEEEEIDWIDSEEDDEKTDDIDDDKSVRITKTMIRWSW
ncbi:hypothetical protein Tco_1312070 [Tanacetum coccineum]